MRSRAFRGAYPSTRSRYSSKLPIPRCRCTSALRAASGSAASSTSSFARRFANRRTCRSASSEHRASHNPSSRTNASGTEIPPTHQRSDARARAFCGPGPSRTSKPAALARARSSARPARSALRASAQRRRRATDRRARSPKPSRPSVRTPDVVGGARTEFLAAGDERRRSSPSSARVQAVTRHADPAADREAEHAEAQQRAERLGDEREHPARRRSARGGSRSARRARRAALGLGGWPSRAARRRRARAAAACRDPGRSSRRARRAGPDRSPAGACARSIRRPLRGTSSGSMPPASATIVAPSE